MTKKDKSGKAAKAEKREKTAVTAEETAREPEAAPETEPAPAEEKAAEKAEAKRSGKKKRKIVKRIVVLAVVLGILGLAGYVVVRKLQADYRVTYDPYTASVGSISNSLSYSGSLQLIDNAAYTASSDCKVREVYVEKGQKVKKGDRLVRLSDGTMLAAEFDGEVCAMEAEKGEEVRAGDSLVQVADTDHMRVSFRIGESDIRDVAVGQDVRVTVASQGAAFTSKIESIDYVSYTGNNVAYYPATVLVDTSGNADVHNGMQATITVPQEEASDVVILKMDAVSTSADNSAFVYKQAEDGSMVETPVTVGVSNGNYVEIKSGVAAGETVYAVVKQEEESTVGGILAGLFGSQQVNAPSGRTPSGRNGGSSPSGNYYPGGGSNQPGSRNRGD